DVILSAPEAEKPSRYQDLWVDRQRWNVLNSLAGDTAVKKDIIDYARTYDEYRDIKANMAAITLANEKVTIEKTGDETQIKIPGIVGYKIDVDAATQDKLIKEK